MQRRDTHMISEPTQVNNRSSKLMHIMAQHLILRMAQLSFMIDQDTFGMARFLIM